MTRKEIEVFVFSLFCNGAGEFAARLVLESPTGRDLGGIIPSVVINELTKAVRASKAAARKRAKKRRSP